ncbi:hypothetical protein Cflav_PD4329 [Pedosphaera parvula Ellin514]|uniref:Uncharacterized protein n=1 Tax=Pedosphaera parvula (strain Ellin514) TaxID=320771 RepID=B9XFE4_PEDPL|nr:hypothetical protein Cflav_PD4329 [Pedosphaera parvula Ellin514]
MELSNTEPIIADQSEVETTVTLKWIVQRLRMGTWTHISNCPGPKENQNDRK